MTADPIDRLLKIDAGSSLPGLPDGLQASWAYSPDEWKEQGLSVARKLAATGEKFTVSDLRRQGLPDPPNVNQWGALLAAINRLRIAAPIGWTSHDRHGTERPIKIWQRTEREEQP